ncbi:4'-phosphopantetheinyl transferase superfamily protein [Ammonicoccus fulvus]|uniref:4'-phosphopantetheinyl transferase superfamily protein n=1 Tax=Ammonicoccus fulvus TaxID=3138240 RepID=A0ABZ3FRF0_9ACTN
MSVGSTTQSFTHPRIWWATPRESGLSGSSGLSGLLSPAERERARGVGHAGNRAWFVTGRALLRLVVGERLGLDPVDIPLSLECRVCGSSAHGRPMLASTPDLHLSIAHAGDVVGVALHCHPIGLDVEPTAPADGPEADPQSAVGSLAALSSIVLTPDERARLDRLPLQEHRQLLLRTWVRKEALLKATGWGLALPPDRIVLDPSGNPLVDGWPELLGPTPSDARIVDLAARPGYVASVAVLEGDAVVTEHDGDAVLDAWAQGHHLPRFAS